MAIKQIFLLKDQIDLGVKRKKVLEMEIKIRKQQIEAIIVIQER